MLVGEKEAQAEIEVHPAATDDGRLRFGGVRRDHIPSAAVGVSHDQAGVCAELEGAGSLEGGAGRGHRRPPNYFCFSCFVSEANIIIEKNNI